MVATASGTLCEKYSSSFVFDIFINSHQEKNRILELDLAVEEHSQQCIGTAKIPDISLLKKKNEKYLMSFAHIFFYPGKHSSFNDCFLDCRHGEKVIIRNKNAHSAKGSISSVCTVRR